MKQDFIEFLNALMDAAPRVVEEKMTDEIKNYIEVLTSEKKEKPELTDNGKLILLYMRENSDTMLFKAKTVAEGLMISSRSVAGSFRKLVTDGFCEKIGQDPAVYSLTDKGREYEIN